MIKKTDTNLKIGNLLSYTKLTYTPEFSQHEKKDVKVKQAVINITVQNSMPNSGLFKFKYLKGENQSYLVDEFQINANNSNICLDITDELQDALLEGKESLEFTIDPIPVGCFFEEKTVEIEYTSKKELYNENATLDIPAKTAGIGTLNLCTGDLKFTTNTASGTFPISHVYSSLLAGQENDEIFTENNTSVVLPNNCCGKGWKLSAQQYLIKDKNNNSFVSGTNSAVFTYINEKGNHIKFLEKFYAVNELGEKIMLTPNQVTIGINGELTHTTQEGKVLKVSQVVESDSGLTLITEPQGYINLKYYNNDIEEVAQIKAAKKNLETALEQTNNNISYYHKNLNLLALSRVALDAQLNSINYDNDANSQMMQVENDLREANIAALKLNNKISKVTESDNFPIKLDSNDFIVYGAYNEINEDVMKTLINNVILHEKDLTEKIEEIEPKILAYIQEKTFKGKWGECLNGETNGYVYAKKQAKLENDKLYKEFNIQNFANLIKQELENYVNSELLNVENGQFATNPYFCDFFTTLNPNGTFKLIDKNLFEIDLQAEKLLNELATLKQSKEDYEIELTRVTYQLETIENKIPVHYITDANGNTFGFGKTNTENVYRLILISDAYENAVYIEYDNSNKLIRIVNTNQQEIKFEYENNLLSSISNPENQKTVFEYTPLGFLSSITLPNGLTSSYEYNGNGYLKNVVDSSGYGTSYVFGNSQVLEVKEISSTTKISKNGIESLPNNGIIIGETETINQQTFTVENRLILEYFDCKSTIITSQKALLGFGGIAPNTTPKHVVTYVFDNMGNPVTVYKNRFENGQIVGNVQATSYQISGNLKSFTVEALNNAEELLSGFYTGHNANTVAEHYFGENTLCGDGVLTVQMQTPTADGANNVYTVNKLNPTLTQVVQEPKLELMKNSGEHNYILCGWAKADSAWVNTRSTDYSKNGIDNTNINTNDLNNLMILHGGNRLNRKFELHATLVYESENNTTTEHQYCSFDWMNTNWQYCAMPLTISKDPNKNLVSLTVSFDYSNNVGDAQFYGMSLKQGKWEYAEYNQNKQITYAQNSTNKTITTYEYENKKLVKETTIKNQKQYVTNYYYNHLGACTKVIDANGIVTENQYNEKGQIVKTCSYHQSQPCCKLYSTENVLNEKGEVVGKCNELGDVVENYQLNSNNTLVSNNENQNLVNYGYDSVTGNLKQVSATANNVTNSNVLGYTKNYLTTVSHNDFDYNFEYNGFGKPTKSIIAQQDYSTVEYNQFSSTTTLASGEVFHTEFNAENKPICVNYKSATENSKPLLKLLYNNVGNLVSTTDYANDKEVTTTNQYNALGNLTKTSYTQNDVNIEIENTYNNNNVASQTFKLNNQENTTSFAYNNSLNPTLTAVTFHDGTVQSINHDNLGRVKTITQNNLFTRQFSHLQKANHTSGLIATEWFGTNGKLTENTKYNYDAFGNIVSIKENGVLVASYEYDTCQRLVRENNKKLNKTTTITYNMGGNILQRFEYPFTLAQNLNNQEPAVFTYCYPASGWKDQLQSLNEYVFEYDALGNPTVYKNMNLTWGYGKQLLNYNGIQYKYNANGIRTSKTALGVTTQFYLNGSTIMAQNNGNQLIFKYGADGVAGFTYTGVGEFYYKKNIQGDIIAILDNNGRIITKYIYDAWGNHKTLILSNNHYVDINDDIIYNESSQNNKLIAEINPFRYRGYYYDVETGLYYLNSRYYDPSTGRFINADGLNFLEQDKINGLNLYAYCGNNPVMNIDPNGNFFLSFLIAGILFGAISGAVVGGIKASKNGTSILGGILGGAVMGGAMGGLLVFGGAVGLNLVAGFSLGSGLLLSTGVGIIAGWTSYSIEAGFNENWNISDFGLAGISGALKGFSTYIIGFFGGKALGAYDKIFIKSLLDGANTIDMDLPYIFAKILLGRKMFVSPLGELVLRTGIIGGIASGARSLIDWIFAKFKGVLS